MCAEDGGDTHVVHQDTGLQTADYLVTKPESVWTA
jgi:hypothetical protein